MGQDEREDCKSPSADDISPEAKRLHENQGSMSDEGSKRQARTRSRTCSYLGNTSKNRSKHQLPNKRTKNPAVKLRGAL